MQCKCGGSTSDRKFVSAKNNAELSAQKCQGCGRMNFSSLKISGKITHEGELARVAFNKITGA